MNIGQVIEKKHYSSNSQLSIGSTKLNTIDNSSIDRVLEQTADLMQADYKKWFAKQAIRLGADRYLGLAKDAREGRKPDRLFVYLLRRA